MEEQSIKIVWTDPAKVFKYVLLKLQIFSSFTVSENSFLLTEKKIIEESTKIPIFAGNTV